MKNKNINEQSLLASTLFSASITTAQIPVEQEPHHKILFENGYVRVIDLHIAPGDTTLVHTHNAASVVVFISSSTFGIQNVGEPPVETPVRPGDVIYRAYDEKPVVHTVWNPARSMFHCLVVELISDHPAKNNKSIISLPGLQFQWQQKLVSAYKFEIEKGKPYDIPGSDLAYLLIDFSGIATVASGANRRSLQPGDFVFFPPQSKIKIDGMDTENAGCVLLELE
jgi:quercetin dioxygenase-like cupin family protein